ncbi:YVTN family beta-propeller repeat protein [Streptomyces sp. H39-S7]|uniref:YVTN family beta-propeller repeat protein n=1 Tax=Streptomyces sp. H39-S7 TaxID=3004357 RepID=UPI0022AEC7B6|nr:beta-propeller fold lactonase family protein [Streptomyces sp. H39-S7]MCZ4124821.1 beta-propeller fold lactonase family protein [Streptomyces sp. H39-S7]
MNTFARARTAQPGGRRRLTALAASAALGLSGLTALAAPAHAVPLGATTAYVANASDNTVSAVDTATNTVIATIPVGFGPQGVAAAPDGAHVYIPNVGSNNVSVIDTATDSVVATTSVGSSPTAVAVAPDGGHVYAVNLSSNSVSVIDTATNTVSATIAVGAGPDAVAITPDGAHAYVTNSGAGGSVSVIDTASNTVTTSIAAGAFPISVAITPNGARAYVASLGGSALAVIDTATNTVISTLPTAAVPFAVAIAPNGAHAYVANANSDTVSVLDTATNTFTGDIPVGTGPQSLAVTPDSTHVYVANLGSHTVSVIDAATATVATTTGVGHNPIGVAIGTTVVPVPPPVVTGVSPDTGPPAGGTPVTITGTALSDATAITFGPGHNATAVNCSATTCTAVAPAGAVGTVDVQVTTPAGTSAVSAAGHFTYAAADVSVSLAAGPAPGLLGGKINYTVTITNHGPSPVTSAAVTAVLPTPMTATSSDCGVSPAHISCTVATLAANASTTRHFTVPVGLLTLGLPYGVTATRTASAPVDLNPANNSSTRTCTVITSLIITCS